MHAYNSNAVEGTVTTCPACLQRAEIIDRFVLASTDGPATHLKVRCDDGHVYTVLVDDTPNVH
ncbi:MAG TPA: hypothetical protein VH834_09390 [Solirubrobacteraceae bacterium]|jgi:hypothetical protein